MVALGGGVFLMSEVPLRCSQGGSSRRLHPPGSQPGVEECEALSAQKGVALCSWSQDTSQNMFKESGHQSEYIRQATSEKECEALSAQEGVALYARESVCVSVCVCV